METIYSVWMRKGPDTVKYDMMITEDSIVLRRLGEYWETSKPPLMLQRRMDLLLYSIRKRRARSGAYEEQLSIPASAVKSWDLTLRDDGVAVLTIETTEGRTLRIYMHGKVYKRARRALTRCLGAVKRAR